MLATRRHFLHSAASIAAAAPALAALNACATPPPQTADLIKDPEGVLDLPPGFTYAVLSRTGDRMSDGLLEPGYHDGMAAFPVAGDPSRCILVRNHEIRPATASHGAFGDDFALAAKLDPALIYDWTAAGRPLLGGTTTLLVDIRARKVERSHLSLAGTATNCAGGATPWGSWLTCEETQETPGANARKMHGYVFEVPSAAPGLVRPAALTDMGRFRHEAAAVDPVSGAVYLTEDEDEGLFYRFLPNAPGALAKGGRLQALALVDQAGADLRNWAERRVAPGARLAVRWIDLADVTAPDGDLRQRGHAAGAALFARGEGMAFALDDQGGVVFFAATTGGAARTGQVWRYRPSPKEGQSGERAEPPTLELFVESRGVEHIDMVDNVVASPWGDLVMCEDGSDTQYVRAVTPEGIVYPICRNAMPGNSEFAGACFSPDGSTLFVNIQKPGLTLAVTGPWSQWRKRAAQALL